MPKRSNENAENIRIDGFPYLSNRLKTDSKGFVRAQKGSMKLVHCFDATKESPWFLTKSNRK